jgi:hypothetical protein
VSPRGTPDGFSAGGVRWQHCEDRVALSTRSFVQIISAVKEVRGETPLELRPAVDECIVEVRR